MPAIAGRKGVSLEEPKFAPIARIDGYLPIEDHGLIGDGMTAALVGRDGAISWMCLPRFDSRPLFCGILDSARGGAFTLSPVGIQESRQYYEVDTGVLITEMRGPAGVMKVTDALTFHSGADLAEDAVAGRSELLRMVEVLQGRVDILVSIEPWGGAVAERYAEGYRIKCNSRSGLDLFLMSSSPLPGLRSTVFLHESERFYVSLRWEEGSHRTRNHPPEKILKDTIQTWNTFMGHFTFAGPEEVLVRRSAITLKLLDYTPTGAMIAAPTSSLPEAIGGPRNWDYRYAWIRDAAFSVYALRRIGLTGEASSFLAWVLDSVETHGHPTVLYDLHGNQPPPEREDAELEGYRKSAPVRWGNAASEQKQHDVYGEIVDCAYQWARGGEKLDPVLWSRLQRIIESARREWRIPDQGIWEVRTVGRPFTYSAALCHVALDRGARLAEDMGLSGDVAGWRAEAERIRHCILDEAWDPGMGAITENLGGGGLDASLLTLPLRRVIPANHPKMVATTNAVMERLGAGNGLIYRYLPQESPDGIPGHEGAFLLCSFWLVDNLAKQGRLSEATDLFCSLCRRSNPVGLLPEEIDPGSGCFLGNFPQAFSHVGLISSAVVLSRLTGDNDEDNFHHS